MLHVPGTLGTWAQVYQGQGPFLLLVDLTHELLRLGTIVSFLLTCEDLGRSIPLGKMRCNPHHGGFSSRVVDALMHVEWLRVQANAAVSVGVHWSIEFSVLQRSTKVHGGVSCCVGLHYGVRVMHTTSIFCMEWQLLRHKRDIRLFKMIWRLVGVSNSAQRCLTRCNRVLRSIEIHVFM